MGEQIEIRLEELLFSLLALLRQEQAGKLLLTKTEVLQVLNISRNTAKKFRILEREDFPEPVAIGRSEDGKVKFMYRYSDVVEFVNNLARQDLLNREYENIRCWITQNLKED